LLVVSQLLVPWLSQLSLLVLVPIWCLLVVLVTRSLCLSSFGFLASLELPSQPQLFVLQQLAAFSNLFSQVSSLLLLLAQLVLLVLVLICQLLSWQLFCSSCEFHNRSLNYRRGHQVSLVVLFASFLPLRSSI